LSSPQGILHLCVRAVEPLFTSEHKPLAAREVKLMLVEPKDVVNTGDAGGEMTAKGDVWV